MQVARDDDSTRAGRRQQLEDGAHGAKDGSAASQDIPFGPDLTLDEQSDAAQRSALRPHVVHEAIRLEGEEELRRPASALWWSGLAAGLSMGFSLIVQGWLRAALPDTPWRPLITGFGYSIGFLIVVLGRQQLFTENTLTVVLPLLARRRPRVLLAVLRLWAVVLLANLVGAFLVSWLAADTAVLQPNVRAALHDVAERALQGSFATIMLRGVMAGWLIALMVWLLPAAETARVHVIVIVTYVVALGGLAHVVVGSVEVFYLIHVGAAGWGDFFGRFIVPALLGNIVGGVALVAALNHAQVTSGEASAG